MADSYKATQGYWDEWAESTNFQDCLIFLKTKIYANQNNYKDPIIT